MLLRQMAVAFLFNEAGELLFLQKKSASRFLGEYLVPIGGHLEDGEHNDPKRACIREIEEETGLTERAFQGLTL
ncbi:NUDIX hydrolase [Paenibacillus ihuae]|uniref:NUDIX hydrolase n=1 Tax=Paenibacillus ihuae TaxID=1232431 RepID=UPI0006D53C06|nr:NUDIX hydrolase [Paenibacillus ihuae]